MDDRPENSNQSQNDHQPESGNQTDNGDQSGIDHQPILAWEMPGNIFARIWLTCVQVLLNPSASFKRLGTPSYWQPYLLALIPYLLLHIFMLMIDPIPEILRNREMGGESIRITGGVAFLLFSDYSSIRAFNLLTTPLSLALTLIIPAALLHLFLRIFESTSRPLLATYKVMTYGLAAFYFIYLLYSIVFYFFYSPFEFLTSIKQDNYVLFFVIFGINSALGIWGVVVGLKGFAAIHQTTKTRVFLAGLSGSIAAALCAILIIFPIMKLIAK